MTSFSRAAFGLNEKGVLQLTLNMISTGPASASQNNPDRSFLACALLELEDLYFPAVMSLSHRNDAGWMTLRRGSYGRGTGEGCHRTAFKMPSHKSERSSSEVFRKKEERY